MFDASVRVSSCGAVTTRALASRVGVSPPVIYRLFGEKNSLLSAVAEYGYARFIAAKSPLQPTDDPVDDVRSAWSLAVEVGLNNAELFLLMYGEPHSEAMTATVRSGSQRMYARIQRAAAADHAGTAGRSSILRDETPSRRAAVVRPRDGRCTGGTLLTAVRVRRRLRLGG